MAEAAAVGQFAGGIIGGLGDINAGNSAFLAAEADATYAEQNAARSIQSANEDAARQRIRAEKEIGSMRANYGASGVSIAESSALDRIAESARFAELDALTIQYGGQLEASQLRFEARQLREQGQSALTTSRYSAAAKVLGGATQAVSTASRASSDRKRAEREGY